VGARLGSPLTLGLGPGEAFLASDPGALPDAVDRVVHLADGQLCLLRPEGGEVLGGDGSPSPTRPERRGGLLPVPREGGKGQHTLEEISQQPRVIEAVLAGRLDPVRNTVTLGGLDWRPLEGARRLVLVGCGTSYHAALLGKYLIEAFARLPAEADHASEFRYRHPAVGRGTVVVALTQSGETADTLAALAEARRRGCTTLALANVAGSAACRAADLFLDLRAGPELGVASTKAFTAQVLTLTLLALGLAGRRQVSRARGKALLDGLELLPGLVRQALGCEEQVRQIARRVAGARHVFFLGRRYLYPVALEGALKLKELSYLPAQGYPAAEMKHGPIALVDESTPGVFLLPRGPLRDKGMTSLEEIRARGGPVIAVASEGDEGTPADADEVIRVPAAPGPLEPLVMVVPLQLLACHVAGLRGCDVDRPRNLAKSVTVE
jgi:glucosamine--fructose-6-phosphate aminotransferase (isomerizing)